MRYQALATDYDGTIAHHGVVDGATLDALLRARDAGLRLVMVTGRELSDLFTAFPEAARFDRIVAENGAVLYDPAADVLDVLAPSPPPSLVARLTALDIPFSVGRSIVATVEPHDAAVESAIRDLRLDWHIIYNKGSVMALPAEVSKATGLQPALAALGVAPERTISVGDAENDEEFLRSCGLAVAVGNALPSIKTLAHLVTSGTHGAGVAELIGLVLSDRL
jgi:hydroxymethylpyrimidine pyrophosphatase-like HAD family hydrolase